MKDDIKTIEYWDIDIRYIFDTLNVYRIDYHDFYNVIERLSVEQFAFNLVYDYRQYKQAKGKSGRVKPLQSLSAIGFLNEYNTFHQLDKFSLSLANGKTVAYHQCYADVVLLVMKNQFYADHNTVIPQEKEDTLLFSLAQKYGYSPKDRDTIKNLFGKIVPNKSKPAKP